MTRSQPLSLAFLLLFSGVPAAAQNAASAGAVSTAAAAWNALAAPAMDPGKFAHLENVSMARDRIHITFTDGTIQFTQPVNGMVTGAAFHGTGRIQVDPPNPIEAEQLALFTKQTKLDMTFSEATFSFTGSLYDEIAKQVKWQNAPGADDLYAKRQQEREELGAEYLPRLFEGVLSPEPRRTEYFLADLKTKEKGWIEARFDAMQPEEVRVGRWADQGPVREPDVWMSFPAGGADPRHVFDDPAAKKEFLVPAYKIDTTVTDGAELTASAEATIQPRYSGETVLLFDLDSNLRVESVKDAQGAALEFFQAKEQKGRMQSYGSYVVVILKNATQAGQRQALAFQYAGKRVVLKVGGGNYFCKSFGWYPTGFSGEGLGADEFAFRSDFDLTFHIPKRYSLVATGAKVGQKTEGKEVVSEWKSEIPIAAAGFAFGDYKLTTEKTGNIEIDVYTNNQPDDLLNSIQMAFDNPLESLEAGPGGTHGAARDAIGILTPSALGKTISVEAGNTLRLFQDYFGPYPYSHLAITNIIGSYGQGWPGLLYLGWFTFLDSTQRHALGIQNQVQLTDFFRAHESSHQWWGHRVGWKSYHDQWLSEGFAEFSGLLYVQFRENFKESVNQFHKDRDLLRDKDMYSHETDALGPIWLGHRIASSETNGSSYQNLIYSKGGYVLQMLRRQMYDPNSRDPDHLFKEMMKDYCTTFDNKPASTEDFKAIVEKHMTRSMNLDGNGKMDWFFNQYVYGTGIPEYSFHANLSYTADGKTNVDAELTRTGVPEGWKDAVPVYAHVGDRSARLGTLGAAHSVERNKFVVPEKIDSLSIDDYEDLLAIVKQ